MKFEWMTSEPFLKEKMLRNLAKLLMVSSVLVGLMIVGVTGCNQKEEAQRINLENKKLLKEEKRLSKEKSIQIAIDSTITPKAGFAYYRNLLDYIGEKLGRTVEFINKESYDEVNYSLKSGNADVAFVCGKPYVDGVENFGLELLVVPQVNDKTVYHSYLIVPVDSPAKNFEDLRGKTFAFADPKSNSGYLVPAYMLAEINETPDSFFEKYFFTYAHDKSIEAVALKLVDGASVDSLIWNYLNKTNSELTLKTKIVWKSPPYGIPPVVVVPTLDPEIKNRLKEIFLNVHKGKKGKEILRGMMIDKFVVGDDRSYDSIRAMKERIIQKEGER